MSGCQIGLRVFSLLFALVWATPWTWAAEGGKTLYLLGKRGPVAGLIPKPGWYVTNDLYHYQGDIAAEIPIAGSIDSGVNADAWVNVLQMTWITETELAGARLAFGAVVPYGNLKVDANASARLPAGLAVARGKSDEVTDFGDPALAAALGWKRRNGDLFRAWNVYTTVFIPAGSYEVGRIANMAANRWGLDVGTAFTMGNFKRGRELSGVLGVTFNGENPDTDYRSGTDLHLELVYKQHLPNGLGFGLAGYYYQQLTDDSGSALLGGFKGRVAGLGPELSYQFKAAGRSLGLDLRWYHEFAAQHGDGRLLFRVIRRLPPPLLT